MKIRSLKMHQLRKATLTVVLVALISLLFLSSMPLNHNSGHITHLNPKFNSEASAASLKVVSDNSPQLVGTVNNQNMLIAFWYDNQLGQSSFLQAGQEYHYNTLSVSVYNPSNQTSLNINVTQYVLQAYTVTYHSGNQTYNETLYRENVTAYDNQTISTPNREVSQSNITLPNAPYNQKITINADGATITFYHYSIPPSNQVPFIHAPVEMLVFLIVVIGLLYILMTGAAAGFISRVRYWPRMSASGWFMVLMLLGFSVLLFYYAFYYDVPIIPWYAFMAPAGILFFLINANIWPQKFEAWNIRSYPAAASKKQDRAAVWNRRIFAVPDGREYNFKGYRYSGFIQVDLFSRIDAFRRFLGRTIPIVFPTSESEPSHLGNDSVNPMWGDNREYILKPNTEGKSIAAPVEGTETVATVDHKSRFRKKNESEPEKDPQKLPGKKHAAYFIPVSQWHTLDIADFLSQMNIESTLSVELEKERIKNVKLEAESKAGAITLGAKIKDTVDREFAKMLNLPEDGEKKHD